MDDSKKPVKYRVFGVREDGKDVLLCSYVSLEVAESVATFEQSQPEYTRIIIESDDEDVRRAQISLGRHP